MKNDDDDPTTTTNTVGVEPQTNGGMTLNDGCKLAAITQ